MRAPALLALPSLLLLLLAGCATAPQEPGPPAPMTDRCEPQYPDGTPKDCAADLRVLATAPPPAGWTCMEADVGGMNGWSLRVELWSDGERWGIVHHGASRAQVVVGEIGFVPDDGPSIGPFTWSGADGHLADLGAFAFPSGTWAYRLQAFSATGAPEAAQLEVRTSVFAGDVWHVYAAGEASTDGSAQATVDGKPGPYVPIPRTFRAAGGDVAVDVSSMGGASAVYAPLVVPLPVGSDPCTE